MLIDATEVISANDQVIRESRLALDNIAFANTAIDTLRAAAYLDLNDPDDITVLRLAVRLINSAGASGSSALSGYYQPSAAHIRDIIEVGFLLDLFRRDIRQIQIWRTASPEVHWKKFSPKKLRKKLDQLDGGERSYRNDAYKFFSEHGTHANPKAVGLISPEMNTMIGPFPDANRVIGLSFDLARHLAAATLSLTRCIDAHRLDENNNTSKTYLLSAIDFLDAIQVFKRRTNNHDIIESL